MQRMLRWMTGVFLLLAAVCAGIAYCMEWQEAAGFDVLGITWLMGNAANLGLVMLAMLFALFAAWAGIKSLMLQE